MALTPSSMVALGMPAPAFTLQDVVSGATVTREAVAGPRGLLVMFICRHCPYVKHVQRELGRLGADYRGSGIGLVAISANDESESPEDRPESLAAMARELDFLFPFLFDEKQEVARSFDAACTPDFFLYDAQLRLVYRGQLDDSRPRSEVPVTGRDLRAALDAVVAGRPVEGEQRPSIGCNIKWKTRRA